MDSFNSLGYAYPFKAQDGYPMLVLIPFNNETLNLNEQITATILGKSKGFDFYEFREMCLSQVRYTTSNTICQDFKSKKGVKIHIVSNYYPKNSFTDCFTAFINTEINNKGLTNQFNYTYESTGKNIKIQTKLLTQVHNTRNN